MILGIFVSIQVAAFAGRLPVVQFLLTLGDPAQAERTDQEGLSALHHASIGGKSDIVAEFMQVRETKPLPEGVHPDLNSLKHVRSEHRTRADACTLDLCSS